MIKSNTTVPARMTRNDKTYEAPAGRWYKTAPNGRLLVVGDWREVGKTNPPTWQEGIDWALVTFGS